jgi:Zn finger protein HypA/HybF involved in hydrogenase expression
MKGESVMAVSTATCHLEPYGMRLTCACGTEQYYGGVDAHIYICSTCQTHYRVVETQAGLKVETVDA